MGPSGKTGLLNPESWRSSNNTINIKKSDQAYEYERNRHSPYKNEKSYSSSSTSSDEIQQQVKIGNLMRY